MKSHPAIPSPDRPAAATPKPAAAAKSAPRPAAKPAPTPQAAPTPARPAARAARWGSGIQDKAEQSELKRLAILRMAASMFNEKGFHETSLNELAARLNVSKPSVYYYVKSKDDILLQVLNQAMLEIDPAIETANRQGDTGLARLRLFVGRYLQFLMGDFGRCLVLSGMEPLKAESKRRLAPSYRRIDASVRQMLREGIADGSIAPCDVKITTFAIFGAMHWAPSWFKAAGELSIEAVADRFLAFFDRGLAASPHAAAMVAARPDSPTAHATYPVTDKTPAKGKRGPKLAKQ